MRTATTKTVIAMVVSAILFGVSSCSTESEPPTHAEEIEARGVIRIGVVGDDVPLFSVVRGTEFADGFQPALAKDIVDRVFGDIGIEWVSLDRLGALSALDDAEVDLVFGLTRLSAYEGEARFSRNYFLDGVGTIVHTDAAITEVADLDGKAVAQPVPTRAASIIEAYLRENDISVQYVSFHPAEVSVAKLIEGEVDALTWSWIGGWGLASDDPSLTVLPVEFTDPLAIALRLDDEDFLSIVDGALGAAIRDETWQQLFDRFYQIQVPWVLEDMRNASLVEAKWPIPEDCASP